jgi:peptide deformylase
MLAASSIIQELLLEDDPCRGWQLPERREAVVAVSMKIVKYPHPALRHASRPLTAIDRQVRLVAGGMLELMYRSRGLGLAANQVAWPFQLFVMNAAADPQQPEQQRVLINPVIVERKGVIEGEEGCLSFPDLYQKVRRARVVKVQAYDLEGKVVEILTSDIPAPLAELTSRVLQHEIDHLHGVLFIDKMGPIGKLSCRSALKEFEREFRRLQETGEYPPDDEIEKQLRALEESGGVPELTPEPPAEPPPEAPPGSPEVI